MTQSTQKHSYSTSAYLKRSEIFPKRSRCSIAALGRGRSLIVHLSSGRAVGGLSFSNSSLTDSLLARILTKQKSPEAEEAWHALIEHNADSYESYREYFASQGISLGKPSKVLPFCLSYKLRLPDHPKPEAVEKLEQFAIQLPRATAPRRLQLKVASGDQFAELAKKYLVRGLMKGIPSLFVDIKSLYVDAEKRDTIERIVESLREEYAPEKASTNVEPTNYLWTLYFLAQHYSFLSQPSKSLELLEIAISHTPTLPELHLARARALKRAGDPIGAARAANEARLLDGQDRFLNTKCGKYLMRAGMVKEAEDILGLFTKVRFIFHLL